VEGDFSEVAGELSLSLSALAGWRGAGVRVRRGEVSLCSDPEEGGAWVGEVTRGGMG